MSNTSPISQVPPPPTDPGKPSQQEYDRVPGWKKWLEIAAVVIGATYTTIAYCNLRATLQVMRADQRAWIVPKNAPIKLEVGKEIVEGITHINTGRTPARKINGEFVMEAINSGEEPTFSYSSKKKSTIRVNALFPDDPSPVGIPLLREIPGTSGFEPVIFTDELKKRFVDQQIWFVVYGRITYDDVFGVSHWVTFCNFTRSVASSRFTAVAPVAAQKCSEYTNVDDN